MLGGQSYGLRWLLAFALYATGIVLASGTVAYATYRVALRVIELISTTIFHEPEKRTDAPFDRSVVRIGSLQTTQDWFPELFGFNFSGPERRRAPRASTPAARTPRQSSTRSRSGSSRSSASTTTQRTRAPVRESRSSRQSDQSGKSYRAYRAREPEDDTSYSEYESGSRRRYSGGTYRTVCVRLCDGYYFPVSFATTPGRFDKDEEKCVRSCKGSAKLFVYRNPGAEPEEMKDLQGRPYTKLPTAFAFRSKYDPSCKCHADPWQVEVRDHHRAYALAGRAARWDKLSERDRTSLLAAAAREREELESRRAVVQDEREKEKAPVAQPPVGEGLPRVEPARSPASQAPRPPEPPADTSETRQERAAMHASLWPLPQSEPKTGPSPAARQQSASSPPPMIESEAPSSKHPPQPDRSTAEDERNRSLVSGLLAASGIGINPMPLNTPRPGHRRSALRTRALHEARVAEKASGPRRLTA